MADPTPTTPPHMAEPGAPSAAGDSAAVPGRAFGLDQLPAGQTGVILQMDEEDHAMLIRLKTMGMHPGRAVRVLRQGSRLVVTCGGTRIGLSAVVARHIHVTPTTP